MNYTALKNAIAQVVRENGNQEITGTGLQNVLNLMINTISDGYLFVGIATPTSNPTNVDNRCWIAVQEGTYANFGGAVVAKGQIAILKNDGTNWQNEIATIELLIDDKPTMGSNNPVKSGGLFNEFISDVPLDIDITEYASSNFWINQQGVYTTGGRSVLIPINPNKQKKIEIKANSITDAVFSFLKASPVAEEPVEFAGAYSRYINVPMNGGIMSFQVPDDTQYINILTRYNNRNRTPSILRYYRYIFVLNIDSYNMGNMHFASDSNGVIANITTSDMNFNFLPNGGTFFIGDDRYAAPAVSARTVSLNSVESVIVVVTYNTTQSTLSVYAYDNVNYNEDIIAVIRFDSASHNRIVSVNAPFVVNIDGQNLETRIEALEESNSIQIINPRMEVFKSIPNTEINEEFQSFCKVGNEFWIASGGSGANSANNLSGYIYRYDSNWNYIGRIEQQVEHFNSISYDEGTDRLIIGQAGSGSKNIYIFANVSSWKTNHIDTPVTSDDIERTIVVSQVSERPNPVWAEQNAEGHRTIIISANQNGRFLKIKLGYGAQQLQYGIYTASSANVPNGTYDIIWNRVYSVPNIVSQIGSLLPYGPTVCQGIDYYKGKIYVMASVTPSTLMELTPTETGFTTRVIHQLWCGDDGTVKANCANEGIMCLDNKVYVGISAIGTTTQITSYNNKILRFDL